MTNRKALPEDIADQFFQGQSVFFQEKPQATPSPQPVTAAPAAANLPTQTPPLAAPTLAPAQDSMPESDQPPTPESLPSTRHDVMSDVTTSFLQDIDLKAWREQIENTETQNSSLRLTSGERYVIEDVLSELQRNERIKTSMNEVARLGLLFLMHDFKQHGRKSLIYQVKKA